MSIANHGIGVRGILVVRTTNPLKNQTLAEFLPLNLSLVMPRRSLKNSG